MTGPRRVFAQLATFSRLGFLLSVAYRSEMVVWMLSTIMPFIMLALWTTAAADGALGRFGQQEFQAYFLTTFMVRQAVGSSAVWVLMSGDIMEGKLSMHLLRPVHPLLTYPARNLGALPLQWLVAAPIFAVGYWWLGVHGQIIRDPGMWALFLASLAGGWAITTCANLAIACLALFTENSEKVLGAWNLSFFIVSGYIIPIELFPPTLRSIVEWLPFRYQLGFPVEVLTGAVAGAEALELLGRQWLFVAILLGLTLVLWRAGVRRFAAYGG